MRRTAIVTLVCCMLAATAGADVIWLQNGKKYEGKVTHKIKTVLIEMRFGTIEVPASDVLRIVKAEIKDPVKTPVAPKYGPDERPFDASRAVMPESVVFLFMRKIAASRTGLGSEEERQQVRRWRDAVHDRVRKVGGEWLGPKEFKPRKEAFDRLLSEAVDIMRQRYRIRGTKRADELKKESLRLSAAVKLKSAAMKWPDPLIRKFMTGVAHYEGGAYGKALLSFEACATEAPLVAAFHQGRGLALQKVNRPSEAIAPLIKALQLDPDSKTALAQLQAGMKAVPGPKTHTEDFEQAKAIVAEYKTSSSPSSPYGYKGVRWLLPGKIVHARDNTLPVPAYHRLVFRQAAGLAIGAHALLADTAAVAKADLVIVKVGDRYVPARVKKSTLYWRGKGDPPVSLVTVNEYSFTPASAKTDAKFKARQAMTAHAMNFIAEMGDEMNKTTGPLKRYKEDNKEIPPVSLRPGDSASPVVTADNRMVGFLAARTNVTLPEGGPSKLWTLTDLKKMIDRGVTIKPATYYWATKRTITIKPAKGVIFPVYGVFCETLDIPK